MQEWRIGIGYDLHAVVPEGPLRLAGVTIPADFGLASHTDGDVVLHAVVDALFGAAGLPDIGEQFPAGDPTLRGADSRKLMTRAVATIHAAGWSVHNVDVVIQAEKPKLHEHKPRMCVALAELLRIGAPQVSVKAKTNEGFDAVGRGQAISCHAAVLLTRAPHGGQRGRA